MFDDSSLEDEYKMAAICAARDQNAAQRYQSKSK